MGGAYSPPLGFEGDPVGVERIRRQLVTSKPDLVYVALGFPKQERLIAELRQASPDAWFVGVGSSLSFAGGYVKRARRWMMRFGLDWVWRLIQERRGLGGRRRGHGVWFVV